MYKFEVEVGMSIYTAIQKAIYKANIVGEVEFIFNDVKLRVYPNSCEYDVAEIYRLKRKCGEFLK